MSQVGDVEVKTQRRVIRLLQRSLGYEYLGDWHNSDHAPIERPVFVEALKARGVADALLPDTMRQLSEAAQRAVGPQGDGGAAFLQALLHGVRVRASALDEPVRVMPIDWNHPEANRFSVAEEVTVPLHDRKHEHRRLDLVIYVNGLALVVIELKRGAVSAQNGIRQLIGYQHREAIPQFFATVGLTLAGNDSQGLYYAAPGASERYFVRWKPPEGALEAEPLDAALASLLRPARLLELLRDFTVFDKGARKVCRPHQYVGVKRAQDHVQRREGGILWHTQGSGKSLTMVYLAAWIRRAVDNARVVVITDRTELDEQIVGVFQGTGNTARHVGSAAELIQRLNLADDWLICSLIHKFGVVNDGATGEFTAELERSLPPGFRAKGSIFVFVDECHRTQSGELHRAMKRLLPEATFIGFTGTPLLRVDRKTTMEVFGDFIHVYNFREAVTDGVVLDLRYEARDIDQTLGSQHKVDAWFEAKTRGLTENARAQLKQRWGTLRKVLSSAERLKRIVADIELDFTRLHRLALGQGNGILVTDSITAACKVYAHFQETPLAGKVAVVTSYRPADAKIRNEDGGEGDTEAMLRLKIYRDMVCGYFGLKDPKDADARVVDYEREVTRRFIHEPAAMRLLIVVDKLLTGFDAPSANVLYIDKPMQDHGLFQALCRVNRLDGAEKQYGLIVDYRDLFHSVEGAVQNYASGALEGFDPEDVKGLIHDRIDEGRTALDAALEAVRVLCEPVPMPRDREAFLRFFCGLSDDPDDVQRMLSDRRLTLYKAVAALIRCFGDLTNDLDAAGYSAAEQAELRDEVRRFSLLRDEVKLRSGDYIDLKAYEPAMRQLIDLYVRADDSEVVSDFGDLTLIELIVERGAEVIKSLPPSLRDEESASETIENNIRRRIKEEQSLNPRYFDRMSALLVALIEERRNGALDYQTYLARVREIAQAVVRPETSSAYPADFKAPRLRALFDTLNGDAALAKRVDEAVDQHAPHGWPEHRMKRRQVRELIKAQLPDATDEQLDELLKLCAQHDHEQQS